MCGTWAAGGRLHRGGNDSLLSFYSKRPRDSAFLGTKFRVSDSAAKKRREGASARRSEQGWWGESEGWENAAASDLGPDVTRT